MKNWALIAFLAGIPSCLYALPDLEHQHRLAIGKTRADFTFSSSNQDKQQVQGDGFKVEYSYDFNRLIGIHGSLEQAKKNQLATDTIKVGADIGYPLSIGSVSFKPFIASGLFYYDEPDYDDLGPYYGFGLRINYLSAFIEARKDYLNMQFNRGDLELEQAALTLGFGF
ncbi:outer membrane beta-barrel protein [Vibrio sp. WXL103]|uniref:outer membrane beta-barrel protein n=1 Tax=Vibrio sp. WXL103 TaxID=3450710 RepID=UPI003EC5CD32